MPPLYYSRFKSCIDCSTTTQPLSNKGLCLKCSKQRMLDATEQMAAKKGPAWDKWKKSMSMWVIKEVRDDDDRIREAERSATGTQAAE